MRDLYPFAHTDVYPDQVLRATDVRPYLGAIGLDNPISHPNRTPVLDQMAEGWGTMTVKPVQRAEGRGSWSRGWQVVIAYPLAAGGDSDPRLKPGSETVAAFAVWEVKRARSVRARPGRTGYRSGSSEPRMSMKRENSKAETLLTRAALYRLLARAFAYPSPGHVAEVREGFSALSIELEQGPDSIRRYPSRARRAWRQAEEESLSADYCVCSPPAVRCACTKRPLAMRAASPGAKWNWRT